jgi:nicotinamide-nucleotide amidase
MERSDMTEGGAGRCIGAGGQTAARRVAAQLDGRHIAVAESCTAGHIAASLAAVDGASEFFIGGVVAYAEDVKRSLLGVVTQSVLCERAAEQMARGVGRLLDAKLAIATTGVAGPDPVDGVAPGTVFVATLVDESCRSSELHLSGSPSQVCLDATEQALTMLGQHLGEIRRAAGYPARSQRTASSFIPTRGDTED